MIQRLVSFLLCLTICGAVFGQPPRDTLQLTAILEKVLPVPAADGEAVTELVPIADIVAGDEVVYTVVFTNVGERAAQDIRITNPIPPTMRYLAGTASAPGGAVLYSVDAGRTFGFPAELRVAAADGTQRAAGAADYTHIRWVLRSTLDAGAKGYARFRAIVR